MVVEVAPRGRNRSAINPFHYASDALGVSPAQIPAAQENLRRHGVRADFTPDGRCIVESAKHFDQVAAASGMRTGRDGYGIPGVMTGKAQVQARQELRDKLARGDHEAVYRALGMD